MGELTVLSPIGMLGYGISEDTIANTRAEFDVDILALDGGSIDPGPNYLGKGKTLVDHEMVKRDATILLELASELDVPLLVSSVGGAGSKIHLDQTAEIFTEVAEEERHSFTLAKIYTDVDREYLKTKVTDGDVSTLHFDAEITPDDVDRAERIVSLVGPEPYNVALEEGADVVLGGRSIDLAPFSAIPITEGFDPGLVYHLAKILECGAHAAQPEAGSDGLVGILGDGYFDVVPPNPDRRCTVESVAAHTLYEKADPHLIHVPGGVVDVNPAEFEQVDSRRVRVTGSTYEPAETQTVLLEGVEKRGYRSIAPCGIRDPPTIENIESILQDIREKVASMSGAAGDEYLLQFRKYGENAVPLSGHPSHPDVGELGVVIDVVADSQEVADTVCGLARTSLHGAYGFEGRINTGGNLAVPFSPAELSMGAIYEFSIYHLLEDVDPLEMATVEISEVQ